MKYFILKIFQRFYYLISFFFSASEALYIKLISTNACARISLCVHRGKNQLFVAVLLVG